MSKVKEIIDLWDTERIGNDAEFHYVTPEMDEKQDARKFRVSADDLRTFIEENNLNEFQTDVDDFKSYDAHDYLMDNWEDIVMRFWNEDVAPRLEQSYKDALAHIQSALKKAGHPLTNIELKGVYARVKQLYGITFGKEAA